MATRVHVGARYTRLVVVEKMPRQKCRVRCDCGTEKIVFTTALQRGYSKSCGCLRREMGFAASYKHGREGTPEYKVWYNLIQRCTNAKRKGYENYGGRGISVCKRWLKFEHFFEDMGERPASNLTIDRINNDGDYEPGNCRWATRHQQRLNQRPRRKRRARK